MLGQCQPSLRVQSEKRQYMHTEQIQHHDEYNGKLQMQISADKIGDPTLKLILGTL